MVEGATPGGSNGDGTVLEVGTFNTHTKFNAASPNGDLGPVAIPCISVGSKFHTMKKCNPNSTAASIVRLLVLQVSFASSIPFHAPLLIQLAVDLHHRCL